MSFLGAIGSAIGGFGKLAEGVCDAVLPDQLEFVGDIASGVVNFHTGNWAGVIDDALDLGKNVVGGLRGFIDGFCKNEPEPPPNLRDGDFVGNLRDHLRGLADRAENNRDIGAKLDQLIAAVANLRSERNDAPASSNPTPAAGGSTQSSHTHAAPSASAPSSGSAPHSSSATGAGKPVGNEAGLSAAARDLLALADADPQAFMNRVRSGDIPQDMLSGGGMLALQTRLQDMQQMNSLLTQIARAMHDMQNAILQNLRA